MSWRSSCCTSKAPLTAAGWPMQPDRELYAQARERAIIGGPLDENGFRKIHLARDGLHFCGGNAIAIGDDSQRISSEALGRENIERVESAVHGIPLSGVARRRALARCMITLSAAAFRK